MLRKPMPTEPAPLTHIVPIFSGGGTRLSAHIGILKALQDMNISFSTLGILRLGSFCLGSMRGMFKRMGVAAGIRAMCVNYC